MINQEKIDKWKEQYKTMLWRSSASDLLDECFESLIKSYEAQQKEIELLKNNLSRLIGHTEWSWADDDFDYSICFICSESEENGHADTCFYKKIGR